MKNYARDGQLIPVTLAAVITSGSALLLGAVGTGLVVVAIKDGAVGDVVDCLAEGVFTQPKVAATAITQGTPAYWDNTNKNFTPTAAGNTPAGTFWTSQLAADTTVQVKLKGR